jgi:hypothetical protein
VRELSAPQICYALKYFRSDNQRPHNYHLAVAKMRQA